MSLKKLYSQKTINRWPPLQPPGPKTERLQPALLIKKSTRHLTGPSCWPKPITGRPGLNLDPIISQQTLQLWLSCCCQLWQAVVGTTLIVPELTWQSIISWAWEVTFLCDINTQCHSVSLRKTSTHRILEFGKLVNSASIDSINNWVFAYFDI